MLADLFGKQMVSFGTSTPHIAIVQVDLLKDVESIGPNHATNPIKERTLALIVGLLIINMRYLAIRI
jgi:hypothetical protein